MKFKGCFILSLAILLPLTACDITLGSREDDCHKQAASRIELYNKPDTSPITQEEKSIAMTALFNECMHEGDYQRHVDTKNAIDPETTITSAPVDPVTALSNPPQENAITTTTQTVVQQPEPVPFANTQASKQELENILGKQN